MSPSYQLPDLLSLCCTFELQTNQFCHAATTASESWLLNLKTADSNNVLTATERTSLRPIKAGLLAALYVPGCGQHQLRFFADFLTFLIIADDRMKHAQNVHELGWDNTTGNGVQLLGHHALFQYILLELQRLVTKADPIWDTRFTDSVHVYHSAQLQATTSRLNNVIPNPETYITLRGDLSGLHMILDLVELSENLSLSSLGDEKTQQLAHLRQLTATIIGCSLDVVAFNNDQAQGNSHNLINILMTHDQLSLQGAVNRAGVLIKHMFQSFADAEIALLSPSAHPHSTNPSSSGYSLPLSYWSWIPFIRSLTSSTPPPPDQPPPNKVGHGDHPVHLDDLQSYVQTLKDFIVGTINWAYETELYFGGKGEEIRKFGWVFLNPKTEDGQP